MVSLFYQHTSMDREYAKRNCAEVISATEICSYTASASGWRIQYWTIEGGELTLKKGGDSPSKFNVKKLQVFESVWINRTLNEPLLPQQAESLQTCWQSQDFIESVRLLTAHGNRLEDLQSWVVWINDQSRFLSMFPIAARLHLKDRCSIRWNREILQPFQTPWKVALP